MRLHTLLLRTRLCWRTYHVELGQLDIVEVAAHDFFTAGKRFFKRNIRAGFVPVIEAFRDKNGWVRKCW